MNEFDVDVEETDEVEAEDVVEEEIVEDEPVEEDEAPTDRDLPESSTGRVYDLVDADGNVKQEGLVPPFGVVLEPGDELVRVD